MATLPSLGPRIATRLFATATVIAGVLLSPVVQAQDFEQRKTEAYQKFHRGEVRASAREIRILADQAPNQQAKALLLRDLTEICTAAAEVSCAMQAQQEAFKLAEKDEALKTIIPDLYYYFIKGLAWMGDKDTLGNIFKNDRLEFYTPAVNPSASALAHLVASAYFVTADKYQAAEAEYSAAILSLLLVDPQNRYEISKILVDMLAVLIAQQDIVGALQLVRMADGYLSKNLARDGAYWAQYAYLATDLVATTQRHKGIVPALAEVARLTDRLDINEGVKLYRVGTGNDLQVVSLLFDGAEKEAADVHSRHPLQQNRNSIIQRGHFESLQELFFAVTDVTVENVIGSGKENDWKAVFLSDLPKAWQLTALQQKNYESYQKFALGVIESGSSKAAAGELFQLAARQRMEIFEEVLKQKLEGFQLPTVMDALVVRAGLASIAEAAKEGQHDLMLRGSELLLRSLRHQLSDFSILLGAQASERAKLSARSYRLLQQQKRDWEFRQIEELLSEKPERNLGAIVSTYTQLVSSVSDLKERLSNQEYRATVGYPDVKQVQQALSDNERFVTYVPTFRGVGRLCISKQKSFVSFSDVDRPQLERDIKLLKYALVADHAADETLDAQFPSSAAVRLERLLFEGLADCLPRGVHINIALPDEFQGIPVAALLTELPPSDREGYDLREAQWLANSFSFSIFVSARHYLGTFKSIIRSESSQSYVGIGDPRFVGLKGLTSKAIEAKSQASLRTGALLTLAELPDTSEELRLTNTHFNGGELLLGTEASEERLRSKDLGKYDVIHFATHGLLGGDLDGLVEPALVLTPVDFDDSFDDGLLTTSEIIRFSLNARLIVLSACNTAKVDTNTAGLGATDLQAAFSVAGAPTLMATLWTVETKAAREIVVDFFSHWQKQSSKSASLALAAATRNYLKNADKAHQHPRFWAPFIVLGYGYKVDPRPIADPLPFGEYRPHSENVGEIIDVQLLQNAPIASVQGDWNGQRMASIVRDAFSVTSKGVKTYEIGAGQMVPEGDSLYVTGYLTSEHSFPILRKIRNDGVEWERRLEGLKNFTFSDIRLVDGFLLAVFEPRAGDERLIIVAKFDLEGNEVGRNEMNAPLSNLLLGRRSLLGTHGKDTVVIVNSQAAPRLGMNAARPNQLGVPSWCQGAALATIFSIDIHTLAFHKIAKVEDYQATKVEPVGPTTILSGAKRDFCSSVTTAMLYQMSQDGSTTRFWSDDDPFSSSIQSFQITDQGIVLLVKRQRPIGIRVITERAAEIVSEKKRWGDDGTELWEFSVVAINFNGSTIWQYHSSFGLSVFVQGLLKWNSELVLFGSLGGRPAISERPRRY